MNNIERLEAQASLSNMQLELADMELYFDDPKLQELLNRSVDLLQEIRDYIGTPNFKIIATNKGF